MVLKFYYKLETKLFPSYDDELIHLKNQPVVEFIQYEILKIKCIQLSMGMKK